MTKVIFMRGGTLVGGGSTGLNPLTFDPSTNNEPLQFNNCNGPLVTECPVENGAENSKKRKRPSLPPEGIRNMAMDSSPMGMPMSDPGAWATAMNNLGMAPMGMTGQPLMSDFDPGLGMVTGIAPMNPMMPGLGVSQDMPVVKEIIHCKSCTLFPSNPSKLPSLFLLLIFFKTLEPKIQIIFFVCLLFNIPALQSLRGWIVFVYCR
ncbi:UNVERIFIED_CONTAM: hypothetical protein FKN15_010584 [Acipenser sinensis]